ncbi:hypothetical protein BRM1_10690 [Brevibacterium sp. BRM-1]|uniref:hypothetical protein n=1 Tax=Brevibacterium sp. BRM-1 TaxID=2999062 RepID=UPI0022803342|nr:hypothetical protein [Brevibacterium sp. BRM-1]WAL39717.1 hypothetical protein BRM1_10690 [Brevibacterium sp. BRM-1]
MLTVRYFAAAKAAAGLPSEQVDYAEFAAEVRAQASASAGLVGVAGDTAGATAGQKGDDAASGADGERLSPAEVHRRALFALLARRHPQPPPGEPSLETVLAQSTCLVDGLALTGKAQLADGARADVLPPFAGG